MGNSFSNSSERTTQPGHLCKLLSSSSQPPYLLLLGACDELDNSSPPAFRHAFGCSQVLPMCWHCFVTHVLISCPPRPSPSGRERPELLSRLAPWSPPASGARDVPARSGSECNRRLGEGSGTSRLSEPQRPGTGRAPKEGSWAAREHAQFPEFSRPLVWNCFMRT